MTRRKLCVNLASGKDSLKMKYIRKIALGVGIVGWLRFGHAQTAIPSAPAAPDDLHAMAGTLAYHLATNAVGHSLDASGHARDLMALSNWGYAQYSETNLGQLTNSVWSTKFWLNGVKGLSATCIGFRGGLGGQGLMTMVSPRHYLFASHMHPEGYRAAFLDTNNHLIWRKSLERVDVGNDISVGILDQDLPKSVGYLPVLPANFTNYLPTNLNTAVQGIGMNQDMRLFGEPMSFGNPQMVLWNSRLAVPFGLGTNWNVMVRGGDSSDPAMLLIGDQLVLVSHNYFIQGGPSYANNIAAINRAMHDLSTHNHVNTDYQLTSISLTDWKVINP